MHFYFLALILFLILFDPAYIQLGFVPKDIAKWISPLSDVGYFSFSAFIFPKEALTAALGSCNSKVQLILHVSQAC